MSKDEVLKDIMQRYLDLVSRTSFRILCDSEDSEAVTVDVFTSVWAHLEGYDGSVPMRQWILSLTVRKSRLRIARRRLMYVFGRRPDLYFTSSPKVLDQDDYITKLAWEIYCRASSGMTSVQRIVYTLIVLEQLSEEEVSDVTGLSNLRIRYAAETAENRLKAELEKYGRTESYPDYKKFLRKVRDDVTEKIRVEKEIIDIAQPPVP